MGDLLKLATLRPKHEIKINAIELNPCCLLKTTPDTWISQPPSRVCGMPPISCAAVKRADTRSCRRSDVVTNPVIRES